MSSPFATFRKHRTYWMAGLVLLAVLAFVVAPGIESMMDLMRSDNAAGNEVVVRWSGGSVSSGHLTYVRMQHARTTRFLQTLAREVVKSGGMPKVPGFRYDVAGKKVETLGLPMLDTNRAVCQAMIIAERAKQLGIEFDKAVIDDFLKRFCDRKISSKQFEDLLKETAGRELTVSDLYRQLGLELSAVVMERLAMAGVSHEGNPLVTPGNLWQNYLRLNQAARVEAFPILTREFVNQVKEQPTDAEIRSLYETGSANFPSPNSPDPGFRRRYQANIEYVSVSWNKLLEVEKAKVTEEALKAEYDRLVALGGLQVPIDPPKVPSATDATPAPPADPAKPEPANPGDNSVKPDEAAGDKPAAASLPDEGQAPSPSVGDEPADAKPADAKPADEKPADEKPADEKPSGDAPAADPKSQSRLDHNRAAAVRLVSFPQDDGMPPPVVDPAAPQPAAPAGEKAETPAADAPATATPATATPDTATPATATPDTATPDTATPATATPATATPATATPATATPATSTLNTATPADPAAVAAGTPAADPAATGGKDPNAATVPMRTQTFEEAKDSLARSLATNVVRELLQTKIDKIEGIMKNYYSSRALEKIQADSGRKVDKAAKPIDLKQLAEAEGLTYGSTGVSDSFRMATSPIGRSMVENQSLVNVVMTPNVELFTPVRSLYIDMENATDPDFQQFVSWKTEQVEAYTPALTDIREEVIEAWKTVRARNLAKEEAEKLADKLRKAADQPWNSVLDAQQQTLVISPIPFTWMSAPREMFAPAEITFVQGLDSVGQEFMQRVFSSTAGQAIVAPNHGLTTYYVVRLVELTPTLDQLRQNFETSRGSAGRLALSERERMFTSWYENIERTLNVQWLASDESLVN